MSSSAYLEVLTASAQIDPLLKRVVQDNRNVVSIYAAIEGGLLSQTVFRRYPAQTVSEKRDYDATKRDWYTAAGERLGRAAFVGPYIDAFGHGWVLTVAFALEVRNVRIVVGADIQLDTLSKLVTESFANGTAMLYRSGNADNAGQLVAHPAFDATLEEQDGALITDSPFHAPDEFVTTEESGNYAIITANDGESLWLAANIPDTPVRLCCCLDDFSLSKLLVIFSFTTVLVLA